MYAKTEHESYSTKLNMIFEHEFYAFHALFINETFEMLKFCVFYILISNFACF